MEKLKDENSGIVGMFGESGINTQMLHSNKVEDITDDELLKMHEFYKQQVQNTSSIGKSNFCLQSLSKIEVELDNRNIAHSKFAIYDFGDTPRLEKFEEFKEQFTTVLESYDESVIEEAIAKNHFLDFKNLSDADIEKAIKFVMEKRGHKPDSPFYKMEEKYKGMLVLNSEKEGINPPIKKQPDYRKFEKNKRY